MRGTTSAGAEHVVGLGGEARGDRGPLADVVQRPRERARGRVLTAEQQVDDVGEDVPRRELGRTRRLRHRRFEEVPLARPGRTRARDAFARLGDHAVDARPECDERPVERAVGGQPHVTPVRIRQRDAAVDHREEPLEIVLDRRGRLFERVHVVAEREIRRHVDRVEHRLAQHVRRLVACGRREPAPLEPPRHAGERREERADVLRVERRRDGTALRAPGLALRREDAVDAHLFEDVFDEPDPPIDGGPLAQRACDDVRVAEDHGAAAGDRHGEDRAVARAPALDREVQRARPKRDGFQEKRHPARPGQIRNRSLRVRHPVAFPPASVASGWIEAAFLLSGRRVALLRRCLRAYRQSSRSPDSMRSGNTRVAYP